MTLSNPSHRRWLRGCLAALLLAVAPAGLAAAPSTFVVDLTNEPASVDPHLQWNSDSYYVYRNIFDNLLTRDANSAIAPGIASSWTYLSDTEVEFTIREGVTFHDGSALTAADVAFSVNRIIDPAFASPQLGQFNAIASAEATSDTTVVVTTKNPYPVLLAQLVKLSIVPQAVVESVGNEAFAAAPVGSGPYVFEAWQRGVKVTLSANPNYWNGTPPFAMVEFRAVPDVATRVANLVSGASHLATGLNPDQAAQVAAEAGVQVLSSPTERIGFVMLNAMRAPTDDIEVRRGLAAAMNSQLIVDALQGGYGQVSPVMLTPVHFGYNGDVAPIEYDLDAAKAAAEAAGDIGTIAMATSPVFDQNVVQALQQFGAEAGFDIEITVRDHPTHLQLIQGEKTEAPNMYFGRWSCGCLDADGVLFPLFHSQSIWSKNAFPGLDPLLEEARSSVDPAVRQAAYDEVLTIVNEQVLAIPLYQTSAIYGAANELSWSPTPDESLFLMRMSWDD